MNHLIKKLNRKTSYQTNLKDYVLNYLGIDEDSFSEGFMKGTPQGEIDGKNFECEYITNKKILTAKNYNKMEYDKFLKTQKFYYAPKETAFLNPVITIKEQITYSKLLIRSHKEDVAFDSRIVGISLNKNSSEKEKLYNKLLKNEKINALNTLATCSQFFLGSSSVIQKADIDNWTIPLQDDKIKLSFAEKIIMNDVLDYIYPSWYEGEKAKINKQEATHKELIEFADIFNQSFNSIYKKDNKEQRLTKIVEGSTFYALEFEYGENIEFQGKIYDETDINSLIQNNYGRNAIINRILRMYTTNKTTLIKPKNLRYWLKSIALRDVDDVFDDMIKAGY